MVVNTPFNPAAVSTLNAVSSVGRPLKSKVGDATSKTSASLIVIFGRGRQRGRRKAAEAGLNWQRRRECPAGRTCSHRPGELHEVRERRRNPLPQRQFVTRTNSDSRIGRQLHRAVGNARAGNPIRPPRFNPLRLAAAETSNLWTRRKLACCGDIPRLRSTPNVASSEIVATKLICAVASSSTPLSASAVPKSSGRETCRVCEYRKRNSVRSCESVTSDRLLSGLPAPPSAASSSGDVGVASPAK